MNFLSLNRITNLIKLLIGYLLSIIYKKPIVWGLPATISVEPTNYCNLHCPECPSGNGSLQRNRQHLKRSLFSKIAQECKSHLIYLTLYFQGEPFLYPQFIEIVEEAKKYQFYTASSSNGQFIDYELALKIVNSGLDKLIISVDGSTQEVYQEYRIGGSFNKAIEAINNLNKAKALYKRKSPIIEMQFIVFKHNEHQINDIKTLSKKLKVNKLSLKTAQINDLQNRKNLLTSINKYARYTINDQGILERKKAIKNRCWRAFSGVVIAANGDVLPCSYDKNGEYSFGNINNEPLYAIWKNEKATAFRKQLLLNRSQYEICKNCTE